MGRFILVLLTLLVGCNPSYAQPDSIIAIKTSRLFDSHLGQVIMGKKIILIEKGTITDIGADIAIPKQAQVIDLNGFTVLPGLIESHSHLLMAHPGDEENTLTVTKSVAWEGDALRALRGAARARSFLEAGYTTVRDLGNSGKFADVALKKAINEGSVVGPRLYVSGPGLAPEGGQAPGILPAYQHLIEGEYRIIRSVDDARVAVREHVNQGVDLIKIYANASPNRLHLSVAEMKVICEEAHFYGLKVTAHATTDLAIHRALKAGVDAIEHGYVVSDSTLALMKSSQVILVPTDMDRLLSRKQVEKLRMKLSDAQLNQLMEPYHNRLQRAHRLGVMIAAGSDMYMDLGLPRGEAAKRVLFAYQEGGLSAGFILQAATYYGARLLGEEKLGALKKGAWADLIAVEGNPLDDLTQLEKVRFVMKDGVIYKSLTK